MDVTTPGDGRWRIDTENGKWPVVVWFGGSDDDRVGSEGRVAAVWKPDDAISRRHALLIAGRRLIVDGEELIHTTVPVSAAVEFDLPLRAHLWSEAPARVTLAADAKVRKAFLSPVEPT